MVDEKIEIVDKRALEADWRMNMSERVAEIEIKMAKIWDLCTIQDKKVVKASPFVKRQLRGRL